MIKTTFNQLELDKISNCWPYPMLTQNQGHLRLNLNWPLKDRTQDDEGTNALHSLKHLCWMLKASFSALLTKLML
jgi:hypothetical protein